MSKNTKIKLAITGCLGFLFLIFTLLVSFVCKDGVGPLNSKVGFSSLNKNTFSSLGVSDFWYKATQIIGILAILVALFFVVLAVIKLIKGKSLKSIPSEMWFLASIYCLLLGFYLFFELCIINYRPILVDGALEASYPSSHTMLALTILGTAVIYLLNTKLNNKLKISLSAGALVLGFVMVVGRLLSGYHWLTDIIGGVIVSAFLIMLYFTLLSVKKDLHN